MMNLQQRYKAVTHNLGVAFQAVRRGSLLKDHGASGTEMSSGLITGEEDNPKFQDDTAYDTYRNMYKTDPIVRAMLRAVKVPIKGAPPMIQPASDSKEDMRIALEVEDALFNNPNMSYEYWLENALRYLDFGVEVMSKRYVRDGNRFTWARWKHLRPDTIREWHVGGDGELASLQQWSAFNPMTNKFEEHTIPVSNIFWIANEMEGDNYRGESLLRSAYRSWLSKDGLIRKMGIQSQRAATAIPMVEVSDAGKKDAAIDFAKKLNVHENAYGVKSQGWSVTFEGGKDMFGFDLLPYTKFHNAEMLNIVFAHFIVQGMESVGSKAKQGEDIDFFKEGLESVSKHVTNVMNSGFGHMQHIKQFVRLNHQNVTEFPTLEISSLRTTDIALITQAFSVLKGAGAVQVTDAVKSYWHDELGLPEFNPDDETEVEDAVKEVLPDVTAEPEMIDKKRPVMLQSSRGRNMSREMQDFECRVCDFTAIENKFEDVRDSLKREGARSRDIITNSLIDRGMKLLADKSKIADIEDAIDKTIVSGRRALIDTLTREAKELFRFGRETVRKEIARQKGQEFTIVEDAREAAGSIRPTVKREVDGLIGKLFGLWTEELFRQFKTGERDLGGFHDSVGKASQQVFNKSLTAVAAEAFGLGRGTEIKKQADAGVVREVIRSERFDINTCSPCFGIDGAVIQVDSPDFDAVSRGPYNECEGGDLCRGINIVRV